MVDWASVLPWRLLIKNTAQLATIMAARPGTDSFQNSISDNYCMNAPTNTGLQVARAITVENCRPKWHRPIWLLYGTDIKMYSSAGKQMMSLPDVSTWCLYLMSLPDVPTWCPYLISLPDVLTWCLYLMSLPDVFTWCLYLMSLLSLPDVSILPGVFT